MLTWLSVKIKFLLPLCFSIQHHDDSQLGEGKKKGEMIVELCEGFFVLLKPLIFNIYCIALPSRYSIPTP